MKKNLYIIGAAALSLLVSSCDKDFLEVEPTEQLSPEQIAAAAEKDPSLLNGNISGLYSTMYNTGTGGTDLDHDDFGQKGYDIYSDMLVSDMVLGGVTYGWYSRIARFQTTVDNTDIGAYKPWRYYYRIIFGANTVIDALGGTDQEQTEPLRRHIMGQAKAMRGYAYFYLAQLYAKGYGSGSEKILPIYTDTQVPNQPKSTSEEVYALIIDDLSQAVDYLDDFNRTSKDQIDKTVAKGLLSYALAARGTTEDLSRVVTLTDDVITAGGYRVTNEQELYGKVVDGVLTNPESGFNNVATPSWMWGVDLTLANDLDLVSWWGQVDTYTYSYAWAGDPKIIDKGLYDAIREDDLRKKQFSATSYRPLYKFFDPARKIGGQRNVTTDYVYMRVEEMILLNAEAKARLGQDDAAKEMLKQLLEKRITDYSYVDGLSGQALLDEIYLQTRIELWGEGKAYLAMKRLKENVVRGANHLFDAGSSFPYNADELTFPIPQAEVLNNPQLDL
ncbi:RagB/SusD family nutrient uptake outer membrane protein [Pontibacter sp. E15-1]|uniref:RagB/SusD family nutrient uptake outer membrane protein n=1 Tax=Pontibacter sp. E15-1 TaxID=2919918 RepID=UPI001F4FFBCD|nr:RagB/SusD family nutrient uptake outer membrane protein [Pontibacter sp. E15-1]MCJ8166976.1 RagB/SusD family nutrient uptake outer membrane protein [Pontibacter sp. E15-1]